MGMYTALSLGVELNIEKNSPVAQLLSYMVGQRDYPPTGNLEGCNKHEFFLSNRWEFMLRSDSYYFDWDTRFSLRWDEIANSYYLSGVSNLKNYDREIEKFIDWLQPYIHQSVAGFIGWTMYEEDLAPTLIVRRSLLDNKRTIYYVSTEELVEKETGYDE